jgi:hypothetical protein
VDLLASHHRNGRRFEPLELIEEGSRVAVRLAVSDPQWEGNAEVFKVFTFDSEQAVLYQDCVDEENARALLAQ